MTSSAPRLRAESSTARLRNVDWVLALTAIGLSLLGLVAIYSATQASMSSTFVAKQAIFLVLGIALMFLGVLVTASCVTLSGSCICSPLRSWWRC